MYKSIPKPQLQLLPNIMHGLESARDEMTNKVAGNTDLHFAYITSSIRPRVSTVPSPVDTLTVYGSQYVGGGVKRGLVRFDMSGPAQGIRVPTTDYSHLPPISCDLAELHFSEGDQELKVTFSNRERGGALAVSRLVTCAHKLSRITASVQEPGKRPEELLPLSEETDEALRPVLAVARHAIGMMSLVSSGSLSAEIEAGPYWG